MKINISDMFDHLPDFAPEIQEEKISADRLKKKVLKKIKQETPEDEKVRRIKKPILIAVILAAALGLCGFAYVYVRWTGFSYMEGLTSADKEAFAEQAGKTSLTSEDQDGNVTYYGEDGSEITMTAEEDEAYREELRKEREQAVQDSTDKVDVHTFCVVPDGITEIPTDETGAYKDFMMGNGYVVIFYPNDAESYTLSKGDIVTINLKVNDACYMEFGYITDGKAHECDTIQGQEFAYEIEIPENGEYCFYIMNCSSDIAEFTEGSIMVN